MVPPVNSVLFKNDGRPFEEKMIEYIKVHWSDVLGEDVKLLNLPNGLDLIADKYNFGTLLNRKVS